VQSNPFNASLISTVIVLVITSNLALGDAPGNVRISKGESGLSKPSVVNVSQILTVDRTVLTARVRALPAHSLRDVEAGMQLALGLN